MMTLTKSMLKFGTKPVIEIVPAAKAEWAPHVPGQTFDWAYRVKMPHGNAITGVVTGSKQKAENEAMRFVEKSSMCPGNFVCKRYGRQYPKRKGDQMNTGNVIEDEVAVVITE